VEAPRGLAPLFEEGAGAGHPLLIGGSILAGMEVVELILPLIGAIARALVRGAGMAFLREPSLVKTTRRPDTMIRRTRRARTREMAGGRPRGREA